MRTVSASWLWILCLCISLSFFYQCSSELVCTSDRSDLQINPSGAKCTARCQCNNLLYEGYCAKGSCVSIPRSFCDFAGKKRPCELPNQFKDLQLTSCRKRVQTCEKTADLYWGDCICVQTQQEASVEKSVEATQEHVTPERESPQDSAQEKPQEPIAPEPQLPEPKVEQPQPNDGGSAEALPEPSKEGLPEKPLPERPYIPEGGYKNPPQGSKCSFGTDKSRTCYTGNLNQLHVGLCTTGLQHCTRENVWSWCDGELHSTQERCSNGKDENCNGKLDTQCNKEKWPIYISRDPSGGNNKKSRNAIEGLVYDSIGDLYITGPYTFSLVYGHLSHKGNGGSRTYVLKLASDGSAKRLFIGGNSIPRAMALGPALNGKKPVVYITGTFYSAATFGTLKIAGNTGYDTSSMFWIALESGKLGAIHAQSIRLSSPNNARHNRTTGIDILTDKTGLIYILGHATRAVNVHGKQLPGGTFLIRYKSDRTFLSVSHIAPNLVSKKMYRDSQGNFYIIGDFKKAIVLGSKTYTPKEDDILVVKIDKTGKVLWAKHLGGSLIDLAAHITPGPSGQLFISGTFTKEATFDKITLKQSGQVPLQHGFIAALSEKDGSVLWANAVFGTKAVSMAGLKTGPKGHLWSAGTFQQQIFFGQSKSQTLVPPGIQTHGFLAKIDPKTGKFLGIRHTESKVGSTVNRIFTGPKGHLLVTGMMRGHIRMGSLSLVYTKGTQNMSYIWKILPF